MPTHAENATAESSTPQKRPLRVAVVTCYDQNDYVRARTLRAALAMCDDVQLKVVRNRATGLLRYLEVPCKLLWLRLRRWPDAYVITFRGYEMLLFLALTKNHTPIIFDELVNFVEYWQERGKVRPGSWLDAQLRRFYAWLHRHCTLILADTKAHAQLSAQLCGTDPKKFVVVPMGADEAVFYPRKVAARAKKSKSLMVFYYGNGMRPLHGLEYVLTAALLLTHRRDISFSIIGGHGEAEAACARAKAQGARISYEAWVPFQELAARIAKASLCLGGPFGDTLQAQQVVTGKTVQILACARPVLVGKNKVTAGFKDKQNCLSVPLGQAHAIANAIAWAADHPKNMRRIALAGRTLYVQKFSQPVINTAVRQAVQKISNGQ